MTDQRTCRTARRERFLNRECPIHGDAEERRRQDAARQPGFMDELRRHNINPMIEPDSHMDTALNIVGALAAVEDWFTRHNEELDSAAFGILLLVQSAREAAHFINVSLDVASIREERQRETAGGEND